MNDFINSSPVAAHSFYVIQIVLGFVINKYFDKQLNSLSSMTTLVIMPIAPVLALVLFTLTRIQNLNYFDGYIFLFGLIPIVIIFKMLGGTVIAFSIMLTVIIYSINIKQDGPGPVIIGIIICWLCKDMQNPITVIICANIISSYITKRFIGLNTNRFKASKEGYDNNGSNWTLVAGFLEAAFIGAPSDVISNNKDMMNGLSDMLCVWNLLINNSTRGTSTVVVTDLKSAILFFCLIAFIYFYNKNLEYIKESDKVWPPIYSTKIKDVSGLELALVIASLCANQSLVNYMLLGKLCVVIVLFFFVRIKVTTSLFFSTNMLF
jgi:hypothetical protein